MIEDIKEILEKSMKNGVSYMQRKDFQINDFLENVDNLKNISNILQYLQ